MNDSLQALNAMVSRFGSADWNQWQVVRGQLYDFVRLPVAGTNDLSFFSNAVGQTDPVSQLQKTYEQTNLQTPGQVGQIFYVMQEIRTFVNVLPKSRQTALIADDADLYWTTWRSVAPVLKQLFQNGVLVMSIGQKGYFRIPLPFVNCPPGFGQEVTAWASVGADSNKLTQQSNHSADTWFVNPPQVIEPSQTFSVNIKFPQNNSPSLAALVNDADLRVDIGVIFDGFVFRPNQ